MNQDRGFQLPGLDASLQGRDLGALRIIAELWGLDFKAPDVRVGLQRLIPMMLNRDNLAEQIDNLPDRALEGLADLVRNEGRLSWSLFTRRYGTVREMGVARRDRERPYTNDQASAAEALWYRGMIGRCFFDAPNGPEEFAYIPGDILERLPALTLPVRQPLGRPASPGERKYIIPAEDWIVDDVCTGLAGLRLGIAPADLAGHLRCANVGPYPLTPESLILLLKACGLLERKGVPKSEETRNLLKASRSEALLCIFKGWMRSIEFNELRLLPDLIFEGDWNNDVLATRQRVLNMLANVPGGFGTTDEERPWWSLKAFVNMVHDAMPDFERPAGDYDSWYVRSRTTGEFLRGFEHWDKVDGELLRFFICGVLFWLGVFDLAAPKVPPAGEAPEEISAFRYSKWAARLLSQTAPEELEEENGQIEVDSQGRIRASRLAPRAVRYQLARFCEWEGFEAEKYLYRLTPASLNRAQSQGLTADHLSVLLRKAAKSMPPNLVRALQNWAANGTQARIEKLSILRVKSPEILATLKSSKAARHLGETLGPTAVIIKPGREEQLSANLIELGFLAQIER